jgi:hypothetical protein
MSVDKHLKLPNPIEFNYPVVDMTFFRKDPRRRVIPKVLVERIGKGAKLLKDQIAKVQQNSGIKYPPTVILPCAIYEVDIRMVIDAAPQLVRRDNNIFLEVRFAAPTVAFADEKKLLGITAHEFIHCIKHTIDIHQKITRGASGQTNIGEVPAEIKAKGIRARDEFHTVPASDWLSGEILAAYEEDQKESFTVSKWANFVTREWIKKGYPTEDFERGKAIQVGRGRLIYDRDIIDKAKKLGLVPNTLPVDQKDA